MPRFNNNSFSRESNFNNDIEYSNVDYEAGEYKRSKWSTWGLWLLAAILIVGFLVWWSRSPSYNNGYNQYYGNPSAYQTMDNTFTRKGCYRGRITDIFNEGGDTQAITVSACKNLAKNEGANYFGLGVNRDGNLSCYYSTAPKVTFDNILRDFRKDNEFCRPNAFNDLVGDVDSTAIYELN